MVEDAAHQPSGPDVKSPRWIFFAFSSWKRLALSQEWKCLFLSEEENSDSRPVFILTDLTRAKEDGEERKARPEKGEQDTLSWQRAGDSSPSADNSLALHCVVNTTERPKVFYEEETWAHSTGSSTQYSLTKDSKKEWTYVCVWLSHFAVQQRLTHYESTVLQ